MEKETIMPIINGSFNPRLTHDQFKELDRENKIGFLWRVLVDIQSPGYSEDIDNEVFEKGEMVCNHDHLRDPDTDLDALFLVAKKANADHKDLMRIKTNQRRYDLGNKFWHAQKECGVGGMIETDAHRAKGYISAIGNWNDFNSADVGVAINKVEFRCPRQDYGVNNPNTGKKIHKWKVRHNGEYVVLTFDFVNKETKERIEEFFPEFQAIGRGAKADSIRIEVEDHGNGYYGVELYWWWD